MKKWLIAISILLLILIAIPLLYFSVSDCGVSPLSCGDYSTEVNPKNQKIVVGNGPEDMAIDTSQGRDRVIVSCADRRNSDPDMGSFYSINLKDNQVSQLIVISPDLNIQPHGIDIVTIDSTTYLYTISHDDPENNDHRIYRFSIDGDTLTLDETHILKDALLTGPNDLDVLEDGSFYVSNPMASNDPMESTKAILGVKNGNVLHYDGKGNWSVAIEDLCYPNGVFVNQEDGYLLVANGGCQEVLRYKLNGANVDAKDKRSTKEHQVDIPIGDNLLIDDEGVLWTAAHPCPLKFLDHVKDSNKKSPMQVFAMDPMTLKTNMVLQNNGELISAASTVLHYGDRLYISQVFDPFVLLVENWN